MNVTGALLPPGDVHLFGSGGNSVRTTVAVLPGGSVFADATAHGCVVIFFFCLPVSFSTGLFYTAPSELPCGCRGLKIKVFDSPRPLKTRGETTTTVTAEVSSPAPPDGCVIDFAEPKPVVGSGGHEHDEDRLHGMLEKSSCTIAAGMTMCTNSYSSSEVAGEEEIKATVRTTGETAKTTVTIKVPGLAPLGPGTTYRLTGKFGDPGVTSKHVDNHNGTVSLLVLIPALTGDYFDLTDTTLGINDMNLPSGGLFDIGNNWSSNSGHKMHRVGKSVDVDRNAQDANEQFVMVDQDILSRYAAQWGFRRIPEPTIHYELP